ncbi:hypothetical protein [Microbacterium sp. MM2322]|uniref:hypothetical protein n=1 Tax=Microbacterium sp. MM2322 TaxID=3157631 RepID=UPI0032D583ED
MNGYDNTYDSYAEQFTSDIADAKRAPEIAAWLRSGPLGLNELLDLRRDRLITDGYPQDRVDARAAQSIFHDLGRIAGLGGPVQFDGSRFGLDEARRAFIDAWARDHGL